MVKTVALCIVALNEENSLLNLLNEIKKQNYPHELVEIILIDGISKDNTKKIMIEFLKQNKTFRRISVLENPNKKLAFGWNIAIKNCQSEVIIRVDAHAKLPFDFILKNVNCLSNGEYICGGQRPNFSEENSFWKQILLSTEESIFGSGIATYRKSKKKKYVKTLFHGAYRIEVFKNVGFFNENLGRTEDNEMHYRMRKYGYKLCYNPEIISFQQVRTTLRAMIKQKFFNGFWIGRTLIICPYCFSYFHFVPLLFVISIFLSLFLYFFKITFFFNFLLISYSSLALLLAALTVNKKKIAFCILPILFFILHICYGTGTLLGIISVPFWKKK